MSVPRELLKKMMPSGLRAALRLVREEVRILRLDQAGRRNARRARAGAELKINIGCGRNLKRGWINVDLREGADLRIDIRQGLPFADETASVVYSEHFFEHLEYPQQALNFLRETLRVLQDGGLFTVAVPDAEMAIRAYAAGDREYFERARQWHPAWCDTWMHQVNYAFRQGGEHKYAYDYETIERILRQVGFDQVKRREFDQALDSESRHYGTLYVQARKPQVPQPANAR